MKALVTGATGLIGSHIVERLAAGDHSVRALVRETSDASHLRRVGVEIAHGDLGDSPSLFRALEGVEVVYHNAALVGDWGRWESFSDVGVEGTKRLLDAALKCGVTRFVHMSSASVYGFLRIRGRAVDEAFPLEENPWRWDYYGRSKIAAEQAVSKCQAGGQLATTILRPTVVVGPRDRTVFPRLAALLERGRLPIVGSGDNRVHLIYAGDVAHAAVLAGTRAEAIGQTYILDGRREFTQREFFDAIADGIGARRPVRRIPLPIAYGLGFCEEAWGHFTKQTRVPTMTRYLVVLSAGEARFTTSKAERELGWRPETSIREALERTHKWRASPHTRGRGSS